MRLDRPESGNFWAAQWGGGMHHRITQAWDDEWDVAADDLIPAENVECGDGFVTARSVPSHVAVQFKRRRHFGRRVLKKEIPLVSKELEVA